MRRKKLQKETDRALLDSIFSLEAEWKQIQFVMENSIEPMEESRYQLQMAQAKYVYLLKEAKHRNVNYFQY